jgi:hypothetical protein
MATGSRKRPTNRHSHGVRPCSLLPNAIIDGSDEGSEEGSKEGLLDGGELGITLGSDDGSEEGIGDGSLDGSGF